MNASEYQKQAARTLLKTPDRDIPPSELLLVWNALSLGSKIGDVAEHIKKGVCHQHGVNRGIVETSFSIISARFRWFWEEPFAPLPNLTGREVMLIWTTIGVIGEAGEIAGLLINGIIGNRIDRQALAKELGDLMWYIAGLCTLTELDLGEVTQANIHKLMVRYPNGYSSGDSQKRVDVTGNGNLSQP